MRELKGHTEGISDVAWASDSIYVASASDDTTVRIWNVDTVCLLIFSFRLANEPLMCFVDRER